MKSAMKTDREMRDLDRDIGFAPARESRKSALSIVFDIVGYIFLGAVLFLFTVVAIHILFYLI